jgi:WD40 repeat protein
MSNIIEEVSENYLCPITHEVMTNPVMAADGNTYQKENIAEWLMGGKRISPLTGEPLSHTTFNENNLVKKMIREFLERIVKSKENLESVLNLCIDKKQELVEDLLKKMQDMKSNTTEVLKGMENSDSQVTFLKGDNSKLNEEDQNLINIIKKNRLALIMKTETGIKQQKPKPNEINITHEVQNLNVPEVKKPEQINIQTEKILQVTGLNRAFKCSQTLQGHSYSVLCLTELSNGDIASGSFDKTIKIWRKDNKGNFTCIDTLQGHSNYVYCLTELTNGDIASGSFDKTIKLWQRDKGNFTCIETIQGHYYFRCITKLSNGDIASGSDDNTIRIWSNTL